MNISEAEKLIISEGLSDKLFEEFKQSLKRVPKNSRCQHCYTTAYNLHIKNTTPKQQRKNIEDAVRLIEYGIKNHSERDMHLRMAYEHLGMIYGDAGEYERAKLYLQTALSIVQDASYIPYFAYLIVRMELHCSNFTYTPYLQELYDQMLTADSFEAERRINIFYRSLVEIILADKDNDKNTKRSACENALSALDMNKYNSLDRTFARHKVIGLNKVNATKKALAFLKKSLR